MKNLVLKYLSEIKELEKTTGKVILKRVENEKNDINLISKISEVKFGTLLLKEFRDFLKYEPNISDKTPDWLINTKEENIILEVLKINTSNEQFQKKINNYKNKIQSAQSGVTITNGIFKDYSKILKKEKRYRELIEEEKYKLIICIDATSFDKLIDVNDIKAFFDFNNRYSEIFKYPEFIKNITGLIIIPYMGDTEFIENKYVENRISKNNKNKIIKSLI